MPFSEIESTLESIVLKTLRLPKIKDTEFHCLSVKEIKNCLLQAYSEGFFEGQKSIEDKYFNREYDC